jgi:transcriptional repressor NrdR
MRCPFCGHGEDRVVDSRELGEGTQVRRRRECVRCGKRFTTYERIEESPALVIKRDGRREPYNRAKVIAGLVRACEKRPVTMADMEAMADKVEAMINQRASREVSSREIGEVLMEELRRRDQVAYVRFASVYRRFEDLEEFHRELERLRKSEA